MRNSKLILILLSLSLGLTFSLMAQAKWTFMVYLDGDNDLEPAAIKDFNEMEIAGSTNEVNIVVQFDRTPGHDDSEGNWTDTRRYRVIKDSNPRKIASPVLDYLGEINMGKAEALTNFINWAVQNYPAQHYVLVLWDHGSSWRKLNRKMSLFNFMPALNAPQNSVTPAPPRSSSLAPIPHKPPAISPFDAGWGVTKDVCYDDTDQDFLSNAEVASALQNTGLTLDLLGYDACLMAMLENAYQARNLARYMVGSEETEPGDGWAYDLVLAGLVANPDQSAADFAKTIVKKYEEYYRTEAGPDQTQSAFDLSKISSMVSTLNTLTEAIISDNNSWQAVNRAINLTEQFNEHQHLDLYDFAKELKLQVSSAAIQNAVTNLHNALASFVIQNYAESGHADARGVAIYFPPKDAFDPKYTAFATHLDFPANSQWDEFLSRFYQSNVSEATFDPYEPNNDYQLAHGPLISDEIYQGYLSNKSDLDIFKIVTGSIFDVQIRLEVPVDFDLYVTQISAYGTIDTLGKSEQSGNAAEYLQGKQLPPGTYYILVSPYETSTASYQLKVTLTGGAGAVNLLLGYDDDDPEFVMYSDRFDMSEGIACYFRPPVLPAKLNALYYNLVSLDMFPYFGGYAGAFWAFALDYYGWSLPDTLRYTIPAAPGWIKVDVSRDNVNLYGDFFAGLFTDQWNSPGVGWDSTYSNGLNLIYTELDGITDWYLMGGTFFIRAEVSYLNTATGVTETALLAPIRFEMNPNYPNPFNPTTTIAYQLPANEDVKLSIYNVLGEQVAALINARQTAGRYSIHWDGRNQQQQPVSSGVYFAVLQAGSFKKTQRMLLIR
ncbi:clostripain-related cysteine peptidase [candidate division KSB1 bacterium]|nr:clostripain-related cysteine peptidase [candidate division KSB1 bacterium]